MKKIWTLLLVVLLLFLQVPPVLAADGENGWLVVLEERTVTLLAESNGLEPVAPESGVWLADSYETAYALCQAGVASSCAPDLPVWLLDGGLTWVSPNDSGESWHWQAIGADFPVSLGLDGTGVTIGLVDSGVYADHQDLAGGTILPGKNLMDGTDDTSDSLGHGTFIAGLLLAGQNNSTGISGLCPGAALVPLKAFSSNQGKLSDALAAVEAAWSQFDCDIINMSFGVQADGLSQADLSAMETVIQTAAEHAVLVAAVGNANGEAAYYPAALDGVIGVGAVDSSLTRWQSGASTGSQYNESVDLTAPGEGLSSLSRWGGITTGSGTSYATPLVTGAIALLLQQEPELTPGEVQARLTATAQDLGPTGHDVEFGAGLLRLDRLLMGEAAAVPRQGEGTYHVQLPEGGWLISAQYDRLGRLCAVEIVDLPPYAFGLYQPVPGQFLLTAKLIPLIPAGMASQ